MILADSFPERLAQWRDLRSILVQQSLDQCMLDVNDWWWCVPMRDNLISWRDYPNWPDPWQLLYQPAFCDLARSLGIVYTLLMIERTDIEEIHLVQTKTTNLVLVNQGKYVLNYQPGSTVNTHLSDLLIQRCVNGSDLKRNIR